MYITRQQLIDAFNEWNAQFRSNPDKFIVDIFCTNGEVNADILIKILTEQTKKRLEQKDEELN